MLNKNINDWGISFLCGFILVNLMATCVWYSHTILNALYNINGLLDEEATLTTLA